jgi:hypothetical protein
MRKSLSHGPQTTIILHFGLSGFTKKSWAPLKPAPVIAFKAVVELTTDLKNEVDSGQKRAI